MGKGLKLQILNLMSRNAERLGEGNRKGCLRSKNSGLKLKVTALLWPISLDTIFLPSYHSRWWLKWWEDAETKNEWNVTWRQSICNILVRMIFLELKKKVCFALHNTLGLITSNKLFYESLCYIFFISFPRVPKDLGKSFLMLGTGWNVSFLIWRI